MVEFHPLAREEHDHAILHYAAIDGDLARDFDFRVSAAISLIEEDPERWRVRKHGIRRVNLKRFPFYIAYMVLLLVFGLYGLVYLWGLAQP